MVSIGSLRYDIIADTTKFTSGMVATRRELTAAKQIFADTRTPIENLGIEIQGLNALLSKGAISASTYAKAVGGVGAKAGMTVQQHEKIAQGLQWQRVEMEDSLGPMGQWNEAQKKQYSQLGLAAGAIGASIVAKKHAAEQDRIAAVARERESHSLHRNSQLHQANQGSIMRGRSLTDQMRNSTERYNLQVKDTNKLLARGHITQDIANRANLASRKSRNQARLDQFGLGGIAGYAKGAAVLGSVYGAVSQIKSGFSLALEMEQTQASFGTFLGSSERAVGLIDRLKEFDLRTTFTFGETTNAAQKLLGFGIAAEDVVDTISRLGDVSKGNAEALSGLTLAYGQVSTKGRLQMEEVNQMIERGFNPLQLIMERTGETGIELSSRMQKGKVSFEELKLAVIDATSSGGQFFGLMDARSKTTAGQLDMLAGKWENMKRSAATDSGGLSIVGMGASAAGGILDWLSGDTQFQKDIFSNTLRNNSSKIIGEMTPEREAAQRRRESQQAEERRLAEVAKAEYEIGFAKAQDTVGGILGDIWGSITGGATALANAPTQALSNAQTAQGLTNSILGYITNPNLKTNQEIRKPAPVELSPSAQRGSREEYALIAKMSASKANDKEAARHNELLKKQDEQLDAWDTGLEYLRTLATAAGGAV